MWGCGGTCGLVERRGSHISIPSVPEEGRSLIELSAGEGQRGLKRRWLKGKTCWERMHEAGSQKQSPTSDHPKPPSPQDAGPSLCWGQAQSRAGEGFTGLKAECLDFTKGNFDWGTERWFRGEELGRGLEIGGGGVLRPRCRLGIAFMTEDVAPQDSPP